MILDIDLLLVWGASYKKIRAGETIIAEGSACSFYHQLVSGKVKWLNINEDGKEFIHFMVEPGDCFGEIPLFDDIPYAAGAVAVEDSIIIRLHKPVFLNLLRESPDIHFTFSRLLAEQIRFKTMLIKTISVDTPETCISTLISYLKEHNKNICPDCHQLKLTRQQIAGMTGLRVETVIRAMHHMHEKGQLRINKGKVYC